MKSGQTIFTFYSEQYREKNRANLSIIPDKRLPPDIENATAILLPRSDMMFTFKSEFAQTFIGKLISKFS